eukprot:g1461.t1
MLPKKLKAANYTSVHIGKWHQGLYTPAFTPTGRGFDHSYGFLEGGEDHNTSKTFGNWCKKGEVDLQKGTPAGWSDCTSFKDMPDVALHHYFDPAATDIANYSPFMAGSSFDSESGCQKLCSDRSDCAGYSWRKTDPSHQYYHRCFLVSKVGASKGVANAGFNSAACVREAEGAPTTVAAHGDNGTYTGELFSREAVRVVEEHDPDANPLFMYLALHNTHAPLEAPWRFVSQYSHFNDSKREIFSGMLSYVDETVKNLTDALKRKGMWENTLFVWTNDNGSPIFVGGSNHPLRGGKGTNWEGGTRVPAFVTGGVLPDEMRGKEHGGLIHISDWHATFTRLAGLDPAAGEPHANSPLDGMDAWPWLSGHKAQSERSEIVYEHSMYQSADKARDPAACFNVSGACLTGALLHDGIKIVLGPETQNQWFGWFSPNVTDPVNRNSPSVKDQACIWPKPCLFNISADITEHEDIAGKFPNLVTDMVARFKALSSTYHPPRTNPTVDLAGYCKAVDLNGGFVGPWMKEPNAATRS